jgi:glucosyl-dolichyl phosphate glucuronosyltransferase
MLEMTSPKLSIVVATRRRPDHLENLLAALVEQSASAADFEIVIIDNDDQPNPRIQALCSSSQFQALQIRYTHHAKLGLSSARNRGIKEASAELIAFLDDDVIPPAGWVTQVFRVRDEVHADVFGGPYTPFYSTTPPRWFKEKYASLNYGDQAFWLPRNKYLAGANMLWDKALILRLGGFSEDFGYVGKKKKYGDDSELCQRASEAGIGIWYDPGLTLQHHREAERTTVRWQLNAIVRHSQMKAQLLLRETRLADTRPLFRQVLSIARKLLVQCLKFIAVCCMLPFRNKKEYPYLENYIVEAVGRELRQVSLSFEMLRGLLSHSEESQIRPELRVG